jgi:hypothetical protein
LPPENATRNRSLKIVYWLKLYTYPKTAFSASRVASVYVIFFLVRRWAYAGRMLQAIDCANYFIFAGYLVFMWGIVGTANYFDAVTLSRSIR